MPSDFWDNPEAFDELSQAQFLALVFKKEGPEVLRAVLEQEPDDPRLGLARERVADVAQSKPSELDLKFCAYAYPPYLGGPGNETNIKAWLAQRQRELQRRRKKAGAA